MGLKLLQEEIVTMLSEGGAGGTSNDEENISSNPDDDQKDGTNRPLLPLETEVGSQHKGKNQKQVAAVTDLSQEILTSAESAVVVLNDLLNYDRIERGDLPLENTIVDIWKLIKTLFGEFVLPYQAKGVNFVLDFSPLMLDLDEEERRSNNSIVDNKVSATATIDAVESLPRKVQERRVVGDSIRISQVIRNLVSNALKFTPQGGAYVLHVVIV